VQGPRFRVQCAGFRVQGSDFSANSLIFGVNSFMATIIACHPFKVTTID
jgi:hypothetical protein